MTGDEDKKSCEQCDQEVAASALVFDEETGMLLCPFCFMEAENCGCADEDG